MDLSRDATGLALLICIGLLLLSVAATVFVVVCVIVRKMSN